MIGLGGTRNILGLAIEPRTIHVSELRGSRSARFDLPAELNWDNPQKLGDALKQFLATKGFSARHTVVGLPGRWLLTRSQQVPPMDTARSIDMLRLTVEREFPSDARMWIFDVAGNPGAADNATVLLAATPGDRLTKIREAIERAGLDLKSITATALALAANCSDPNANQAMLHVTGDGAELAMIQGGRVTMLERLSYGGSDNGHRSASLEAEVRRVAAMTTVRTGQTPARMTVVDSTAEQVIVDTQSLSQSLGMPVATADKACGAAMALAQCGTTGKRTPVDFLHSRLAEVAPRRWTSRRAMLAGLGIVLLLAVGWYVWDWHVEAQSVASLEEQLAGMRNDLATARVNVDRTKRADGWFSARPPMLDCLRAITVAFPETGPVRTTSLSLREDLTGTLAGKAPDEKSALALIDGIKSSTRFRDVKTLYLRQEDRRGSTVAFALTFTFVAEK